MRTTEEFAKYAKETLEPFLGDSEVVHCKYDDLIEERLNELEPGLLELMPYPDGEARWCA